VLTGKRVVVTGGTGSLGRALVQRLLSGDLGAPDEVVVFSRDEAKQHDMRLAFEHLAAATDDVIYETGERLQFRIGSVSDLAAVSAVLRGAHVVFNAAALKQVPSCEYAPMEAVRTNILGPENIVRAIRDLQLDVETVVSVSTDKACKPVNVMGMTKAIQERVFIQANLECPRTKFVAARYGNVLASRGSVVPLFHHQIRTGGPVTITAPEMTRFLLPLDRAVDTILYAMNEAQPGEVVVPRVPAARIVDVASALIGDRDIPTKIVGIRPGEKVHEILVSEEEAPRTVSRVDSYAIQPGLPQLSVPSQDPRFEGSEYSSSMVTLEPDDVASLLREHQLMVEDEPTFH
jgi:FlaA1/EpsC-like NDP-sugar epimerase